MIRKKYLLMINETKQPIDEQFTCHSFCFSDDDWLEFQFDIDFKFMSLYGYDVHPIGTGSNILPSDLNNDVKMCQPKFWRNLQIYCHNDVITILTWYYSKSDYQHLY